LSCPLLLASLSFPYTTLFRSRARLILSFPFWSKHARVDNVVLRRRSGQRACPHQMIAFKFPIIDWRQLVKPCAVGHRSRTVFAQDRKSTSLNSSHQIISYAVL